ncbi:MAG: hypothetical protein ACYDHH_12030 [Solirubrobacteraceae bacterium]
MSSDPEHRLALESLSSLPGHDLVADGLEDLAAGRETAAAMLVSMAASRLRAVGIDVPTSTVGVPSHRLYALLEQEGPGAHSRYNALVGRLVSFARAAEGISRG